MNIPELLTATDLTTLIGASFAVALVGNVSQYAFNWNPRWLGLIVALLLPLIILAGAERRELVDWIVAFFRGLQVYATAVGITSIAGREKPIVERGGRDSSARVFWTRWF
jgi:hypothetical protein